MHSIGQLSHMTDVKIPTIRYYEQIGLLDQPVRTDSNQRRYAKEDIMRLAFIKHARDLGMPVEAIRDLIKLSNHPDKLCADADQIAKEHLSVVRAQIAKLKRLEKELARIASSCKSDKIGDCYVIRALADHSLCKNEH